MGSLVVVQSCSVYKLPSPEREGPRIRGAKPSVMRTIDTYTKKVMSNIMYTFFLLVEGLYIVRTPCINSVNMWKQIHMYIYGYI